MLSTIPRQIATQQAENDTTIWPAISACLGNITLWYITAMSTQEKDLLRRSQPIGPLRVRVTYRTMHIWTNWNRPMCRNVAPAHPSHHVFQPPDFVLYLGPGPGEVLKNQSVRSTHHIPEILIRCLLSTAILLFESFHCGRRTREIPTTN